MTILSEYAKKEKKKFFLKKISKTSKILEIGSGSGWVKTHFKNERYQYYTGIDILPPADIVGDIRNWKNLGLKEEYYDYIIAFEVVEHVDIIKDCYKLLKKDGKLLITTPLPHMDWFLYLLERIGLNQKRTSAHSNLIYLKKIKLLNPEIIKYKMQLSQWAVLKKI